VDNGQHVFLRCCIAYRGLLGRLGVGHLVTLQHRLDIPVTDGTRRARLRRRALPAPWHLAPAIAHYPWLAPAQRVRFACTARALDAIDPDGPEADRRTFGSWLAERGESDAAVRTLWDLVTVASLNSPAREVSLALAATVFQRGLLDHSAAGDLGWATVPLQQLHGDAAMAALRRSGVRVRLHDKAGAVVARGHGWAVLTGCAADAGDAYPTDGTHPKEETADAVIVAVPPEAAARILPATALDLPPDWAGALGASPIVNLHLVVNRPALHRPFVAGISDSPAGLTYPWIFDRTQAGEGGQHLAVSLSAADDLIDLPTAALRDRFMPELTTLLPSLGQVRLDDFFVTRERTATFRPAPGVATLRPPASTRLPGLFVAGAWTATGWPATMEGAVRSGQAAAEALLAATRHTGLVRVAA
jgi:squalene-associated FAD-dependent desaturase